ncbi:hypothetical protein [Aquimarina megaterium]|uniref:hypothetical protein n=1 Tax=Aquimarina megaterium TaxID=1443666 RepID=UPI000472E366|nr:hypothetical protein [Aquimarina megaterium]
MKSILEIQGVQKLTKNQQAKVKAGNTACCTVGAIQSGTGNWWGGLVSWACVCKGRKDNAE